MIVRVFSSHREKKQVLKEVITPKKAFVLEEVIVPEMPVVEEAVEPTEEVVEIAPKKKGGRKKKVEE